MLRVFCPQWDGGVRLPPLAPEEAHHLFRVRRARPGEPVELLNGSGAVGHCRAGDGRGSELELESVNVVPPPALRVHLLVALPKGRTFPALLQKAVELGVSEITPLVTEHAEAVPDKAGAKLERWESILVEALKQSGNPWLPVLAPPLPLATALARGPAGLRLCAALQPDAVPLWSFLQSLPVRPADAQVFVGPEGDFSPAEYARMRAAGCHFVSLGPLVLRVETAATLVAGALHLYGMAASPAPWREPAPPPHAPC